MELKTAVRISLESSQYLAGLEAVRAQSLKTYGALKEGVRTAEGAWKAAQDEVRKLAVQMGAVEAPTNAQAQAFKTAVDSAGQLKARYLELRDAVQAQRTALAQNASAIAGAQAAHATAGSSALNHAQGVRQLTTETRTLTSGMGAMAAAVAGAIGVGSVREVASLLDQYSGLNGKIKVVTASNAEFAAGQAGVQKIARDNGAELASTGQLYARSAVALRQVNMSQADSLRLTNLVSTSLRINRATTAEQASATLQFAQALGSGVIRGEELNAVLEAAPRLAQAMADGLNVPQTKLKELGEQGALTSLMVAKAVLSQEAALKSENSLISTQLSEAWRQLGNATQIYVGKADEAQGVSMALAGGIGFLANNVNVLIPTLGIVAAGLGALAATSAIRTLAGLAIAAGPVGWALAAASAAAVGLWAVLSSGSQGAIDSAEKSLKSLTKEVVEFSGRMTEAAKKEKFTEIEAAVEQLRETYVDMARQSPDAPVLERWKKEIQEAEVAMEKLKSKAEKPLPLIVEKSALGIANTSQAGGQVLDKKHAEALNGFDAVYKAFVNRTVDSDGKLVVSFGQVRMAIANLFAGSKTPQDFNALLATFQKAMNSSGDSTALITAIANAAEARRATETKALNDQVAGLKTRADRAAAAFSSMAEQARLAAQLSTGMDRVKAELVNDTKAISTDQAASARAAVVAASASASAQISLIEQVSASKISLIEAETKAVKKQTDLEIEEDERKFSSILAKRDELAKAPASAVNSNLDKGLAIEQAALLEKGLARRKAIAEQGGDAEVAAIRRVADVDRQTAQERLTILRGVQQEVASKANEALNNYKTYAQKVIDLDRQIVQNRLNTASSIESIKRKDQTPTQQLGSLRAEMESLQAEAGKAKRDGDQVLQQEILGRQKSVAGELANVKGDGIDSKGVSEEAIGHLQRIGDESGVILKAQREEAQAAAEQQKATFEALAQAAQRLSVEIGKINTGEAIKLKAEIDTASVDGAIEQVRSAFASQTFAIKVAAKSAGPEQLGFSESPPIPGRADGGPIGGVGGPRADNQLTWLSPGEHVMTASEVQSAGGHGAIYGLRSALRGGWIPRFADGGAVGSVVSRLSIPEMSPSAGASPLQPMNITLPGGQTFPVQAPPDVAAAFERHVRLETLKRGRI